MKKGILLIVTGAAIYGAYHYGKSKAKIEQSSSPEVDPQTVRTGAFSKEIENLQRNINEVVGRPVIEVTGAYSNEFKEVINEMFKNTEALVDPNTGEIKTQKLHEFNQILTNLNNIINPKK